MKFFKKTLALVLSAGMVFGASAPAMAADGTGTLDSGVRVLYSNVKESYVSIDTKEANAKSEWFGVTTNDGSTLEVRTGAEPTIKAVLKDVGENKTETDTVLADTLSMAPINGQYSDEWGTRFLVNAGKTPQPGIYYVTLDIPMIESGKDSTAPVVYGQAKVELHVNSGDPSYVKGNEIRFDMEFNGQAQTLTSQSVQIVNPSNTNLTGVQGKFYSDAACTQELSYLSVTDATSNSFKVKAVPVDGVLTIPYTVYFKMQTKARAVFTPVLMTTGVYATNPESVFELVYDKNLDVGSESKYYTDVMIKDRSGDTAPVSRVTLLENTFDDKEAMEVDKNRIYAYEKATGKFEAKYSDGVSSEGYQIANAVLVYKDRPISSTGTYIPGVVSAFMKSGAKIDLNNLDTYTVPMKVYGYDANGKAVTPKSVILDETQDNGMFEIVANSVKANEAQKCLEFSLKLKNQAKPLFSMSNPCYFKVGVENFVVPVDDKVELYAGQPEFYLSEAGSSTSLNDKSVSMSLGSTKKFDLHVKGYRTNEFVSNQIGVFVGGDDFEIHNQSFNIVRGSVLFVPASGEMVETITVRYNTPVEQGIGDIYLTAGGKFAPAITNEDVLLKLDTGLSNEIYSMVEIKTSSSSGGGSSGGGGGGGGGGTGGPATSGNKGLVNGSGSTVSSPVTTTQATAAASKAVAAAKAAGSDTANVKFTNVSSISPAAISAIANAAKKAGVEAVITADTKVGGAIVARISMDPADLAGAKSDVKLGVTIGNKSIISTFGKYFTNQVQVVSFAQKGAFGTAVNVAVKVDLTKLNVNTLKFYSYDASTNKYTEIKVPAYFVDTNGYLHFTTTVGNHVVITDKPLTSK